ncbi:MULTISPECIES: acyltransferase [unclassified Mesorhizobium]|uniref:acyltransferase family protein n=1 Tax=unclassified Mesorhizobium TaxID=325217 RepID=UPI0003CF06CD|nr:MULTISPECIES: acyltransferase [unclassified Mesorhizobium]ESX10294.1 acetyltransferase [Mesorhizobium sp. LSJC265A00]ESY18838.1 acetyltransferase [Mesorhizobium sp. LNJC394B00]ESY33431.1 acetyltransferase [Mesorhizobium sp. LNJC391B00]ESZ75762.1 acetyltransferase [Mesorhizobium sp. L103C105A0]
MQPAAPRHVYLNLDAIRGVAAISVMLYHFSPFLAAGKVLPSSYLAVDLFFLLSGFVIAHAYDRKIENGMGFGTFLAIRLIRLYPLYLAGTLLGFFYLIVKNRLIPAEYMPISEIGTMLTTGMFFIPLVSDAYHTIFPLNPASWSLFFELIVNIAYVAVFFLLTKRVLTVLIAVSLVLLVIASIVAGTLDFGMTGSTIISGLPRVCFSFFLGVLLCRSMTRYQSGLGFLRRGWWVEGAIALTLIVFAIAPAGGARVAYDLACVVFVFPALVVVGTIAPTAPRLSGLYGWLGRISYPIYIIHTPLLMIIAGAGKAAAIDPFAHHPWFGIVMAVSVIVIADIATRVYDEPLRRFLQRLMLRKRAVA